jgi:hypothetical protein
MSEDDEANGQLRLCSKRMLSAGKQERDPVVDKSRNCIRV